MNKSVVNEILTPLVAVAVDQKVINPHDFFRTREGLWVSPYFDRIIAPNAPNMMVSADETTIGYADLLHSAGDDKIGTELPEGYVFEDLGKFLVHLATLIMGQWSGKSGHLINTGLGNILYVKMGGKGSVFVFNVAWQFGSQRWRCRCYPYRRENFWGFGYRAFSATAP